MSETTEHRILNPKWNNNYGHLPEALKAVTLFQTLRPIRDCWVRMSFVYCFFSHTPPNFNVYSQNRKNKKKVFTKTVLVIETRCGYIKFTYSEEQRAVVTKPLLPDCFFFYYTCIILVQIVKHKFKNHYAYLSVVFLNQK